MNANASTKKLEMKIGFHRLNPLHSKPLFIVVERFDMDNFPVRVWHLRLTQNKASETSSDTSSLKRRAHPQ
jgi:hypothetical protein